MKHHVVFVPGLGGENVAYDFFIKRWSKYGVIPYIYDFSWTSEPKDFNFKLNRFLKYISKLQKNGDKVSLVGTSAGGSAVLNAYLKNPKIHAVVNSCGRLRAGENVRPSLDWAARKSPAFKESVLIFEENEKNMTRELRKKVMTISPLLDEIVPRSTICLKGATNINIPIVEHIISGFLVVALFSPAIFRFILKK